MVVALIGLVSGRASADVTGFVRDQDTLTSISGAVVRLQAADVWVETGPDGSFTLPIADGTGLVIVGASKSYYNRSVIVDATDTGVEILLEPVPQSNDPSYSFLSPDTCGACHPDQYYDWVDTPMAKAGANTWVHDIYSGSGTPGGMGGFVYLRDSVFAASNPASECASCHQPESWIQDPFSSLQAPSATPSLSVQHGVSCDVCHKIADVDVSKINFPGIFPGAVTHTRPQGPDYFQVQYGVLGDVDFRANYLMRASYQPQLVAEVCGTCHQDKNDPDENHTYTGVTSEPTYIEWIESPYGDIESPFYATCVDCHMPATDETEICTVLFPPLVRDPDTIRSHTIEGTTPRFLENAVELNLQTKLNERELSVELAITNSLTGHHVPTGVTIRNMILLVEVWRDGDDPFVNPLNHLGSQTIHELGGVGDPSQGYYADLPGKFYGKVNHDASGNGPTFFTDATGIQFDTRIPALATDSTSYRFALPPSGGTVHVRARLIYRRAFRFLVDAKQWTQDGHGNSLADIVPPDFGHLMEVAEGTVFAEAVGACCLVEGACATLEKSQCETSLGTFLGDQSTCEGDADSDGIDGWCGDACPDDSQKTAEGACGCGNKGEGDADLDTVPDCLDRCRGADDLIDADENGVPDCLEDETIPTMSDWGLVILGLMLLAAAKVSFRRRALRFT